ncbi:MAG: ATP-binding protein [Deltaproteobacteria bacterium]|nr:ATP-binding protein [Deltaproteobacteria bacterium]
MTVKAFRFDALVDEPDFCNYHDERQRLLQSIAKGRKVLLFGRRNFGKTSLVRNVVANKWMATQKKGAFLLYVDFYGVRTMSGLVSRLSAAFADSFQRAFSAKSLFQTMLDSIKRLRPRVEMEPNGQLSLTLGLGESAGRNLTSIFQELGALHKRGVPLLVVLDEFQDVHYIDEAEGLIRGVLESHLGNVATVILGSKKHLLSQMFTVPHAPFANWGEHLEMSYIPYEEYTSYANERLAHANLRLDDASSRYLQDLVGRVPEAMNRLADSLIALDYATKENVTIQKVDEALRTLISRRSSAIEEYLSHFTGAEEQFLITLAFAGGSATQLTGKDFIAKSGLSIAGLRKVAHKLEDHAVIYREGKMYTFADPLIMHHILKYRA